MDAGRTAILVFVAINPHEVARVGRHPLPGEMVVTDSIDFSPGGSGANQAIAVAASGLPVRMQWRPPTKNQWGGGG
jgi:ribokinase